MTFTAGKANRTNFNKNRMMRLSEMPQVTVQIIKSTEPPSGVGEPGVPPIAPALANAYARLTGNAGPHAAVLPRRDDGRAVTAYAATCVSRRSSGRHDPQFVPHRNCACTRASASAAAKRARPSAVGKTPSA